MEIAVNLVAPIRVDFDKREKNMYHHMKYINKE